MRDILANKTLVIATNNEGKRQEFAAAFAPLGVGVRSLADFNELPEIIEDGVTFADNAQLKAKLVANHLQLPVLADDSGLCVDALDGRPGVYSARYAGEQATDEDNNNKLLAELKALRQEEEEFAAENDRLSTAHFVCALALYDPLTEKLLTVEGRCSGYITAVPRGTNGFGYDPLFFVPQYGQTMAELPPQLKMEISHRGEAIRQLLQRLGH